MLIQLSRKVNRFAAAASGAAHVPRRNEQQSIVRALFDSVSGTYAYLLASRRSAEALAGTPEVYDADNIAAERAKWSGDVQVAQDVIGGRAARNSRERALL